MMMEYINRSFWLPHLAIDIGTYAIRVSSVGQAIEVPAGLGRLRGGVIIDRDAVTQLLSSLVLQTRRLGVLKPRAIACAPSDVTREEREAVTDCVRRSGVERVVIVPEPLAAAVGAGVDVASSYAHLLIDIGEGVTDCAVIKGGRVIESHAMRTGCANLREEFKRKILCRYGLRLENEEADLLLRRIGAVGGSDLQVSCGAVTGKVVISVEEVADAVDGCLSAIIETVRTLFLSLDDSLAAEVIDSGACLTGGGALINGVRAKLEAEVGIRVMPAPDPLHSVVNGAQSMLPVVAALKHWQN